jgi:hypothetical protein
MYAERFTQNGFAITGPLLSRAACAEIESVVDRIAFNGAGTRSLIDRPWCQVLSKSIRQYPDVRQLLPDDYVAVQCTYFEKSVALNWLVPLHQDLSIPVKERIEHPELTGWSEKDGSIFVQPPREFLEKLVALRLHIDECGLEDGPLKVISGSHLLGRLCNDAALEIRAMRGEVACPVEKGCALMMRPLLLHASSKSVGQSRRRVLHFVFGPRNPPYGLTWRHAV